MLANGLVDDKDRFSREGSATQRDSVVVSSPMDATSVSSSTPATPAVATSSKPLPSLLPSVLLPPSPKQRPAPAPLAIPTPPRPALPTPSQPSSAQKRKSSAVELEEARERTDRHLTPQEQLRLSRAIHKLSGAQLERAIEMIQSGVGNTPLCENQVSPLLSQLTLSSRSNLRPLRLDWRYRVRSISDARYARQDALCHICWTS